MLQSLCVNAKQHCLGQHETRTACSAIVHTEHQCHVISQTYTAQQVAVFTVLYIMSIQLEQRPQSYLYTPCHNNMIMGVDQYGQMQRPAGQI